MTDQVSMERFRDAPPRWPHTVPDDPGLPARIWANLAVLLGVEPDDCRDIAAALGCVDQPRHAKDDLGRRVYDHGRRGR